MNLILKTPTTDADSISGINDSGVETFTNTPLESLTKEELQNSTDQALLNEDGTPKKVTVQFHDFYLSHEDFPQFEKTKQIYEEERKFWDKYQQTDKKPTIFFDRALEVLNKERIRCFRFSDFNTTGLTGIHSDVSSPWNNLVKNSSVSDKEGRCGGSFGIGKNAAFACSQLRIVFYNTINIEGEEGFQGCMKVPDYKCNDINYTGNNFYCVPGEGNKCLPIEKSTSLDPNYTRRETGMDKFIIGFNDDLSEEDLKKAIIASSIDNFLVAIYKGLLDIFYEEDVICDENLEECISKLPDDQESKQSIIQNFETLKSPDVLYSLSMFEDDDIDIYIKLGGDYSREAAVVRQNGMKVFEKDHIRGRIGFKAIVHLKGNKVNEYFKKLENAEHTKWSVEKADNPNEARKKQKQIFDSIKEKVEELNGADAEPSVDSDGLSEYLPSTYVTGKKNKVEGLSNEVAEAKKKVKKKTKKSTTTTIEEQVEYQEDENGNITIVPTHHGEKETAPGPLPPFSPDNNAVDIDNDGNGNSASEVKLDGDFVSKREIPNRKLKCHLLNHGKSYSLSIHPNDDFNKGYIELAISGEDKNIEAVVASAKVNNANAKIQGNKILFDGLTKDQICQIDFELKMPGEWALEVKAHESKN